MDFVCCINLIFAQKVQYNHRYTNAYETLHRHSYPSCFIRQTDSSLGSLLLFHYSK